MTLLFWILFLSFPVLPDPEHTSTLLWLIDISFVIQKDTRLKDASPQQLYLGSYQGILPSEAEDAFMDTLVSFLACQAQLPLC